MPSLFAKLDPDAARLQTLVHRHAAGLAFETDGRRWRHEPGGATAVTGPVAYGALGRAEFSVWLNEPDWRVAAASVLGVGPGDLDGLPEPLLIASLECFADAALAGLEQATGLPAALTRFAPENSSAPSSACRFTLRADGGPAIAGAWVVAGADAEWRRGIEESLRRLPAVRAVLPDDMPVPAAVALGVWTMTVAEAESLAVGDVALSPAGAERVAIIGGRLRCAARLRDGVLTVEGNTMTDAEPAPAPEDDSEQGGAALAPEAMDAVEVDVQARVGRIAMTLGQLRQLGAGQVVEFSTPVETPVSLVVGGKTVARGELVDVGGRVGVRITAMAE